MTPLEHPNRSNHPTAVRCPRTIFHIAVRDLSLIECSCWDVSFLSVRAFPRHLTPHPSPSACLPTPRSQKSHSCPCLTLSSPTVTGSKLERSSHLILPTFVSHLKLSKDITTYTRLPPHFPPPPRGVTRRPASDFPTPRTRWQRTAKCSKMFVVGGARKKHEWICKTLWHQERDPLGSSGNYNGGGGAS